MNFSASENIYSKGQELERVYAGGELVWEKTTVNVAPIIFTVYSNRITSIRFTCSEYNKITIKWGDGTETLVVSSSLISKYYSHSDNWDIQIQGDTSVLRTISIVNKNIKKVKINRNAEVGDCTFLLSNNPIDDIIIDTGLNVLGILSFYSTTINNFTAPDVQFSGGYYLSQCYNMVHFQVPKLHTVVGGITLTSNNNLLSIDAPELRTITENLEISGTSSLSSVNIDKLEHVNAIYCHYSINFLSLPNLLTINRLEMKNTGMSATDVDNMLLSLIPTSENHPSSFIDMRNNSNTAATPNSAPTSIGRSAATTLRNNGWTVYHR